VERLESRELLSAVPPAIIAVTPADGSPVQGAPPLGSEPKLTVTFSQNVVVAEADNVSNYLLFGSHNNQITVDAASYVFNGGTGQGIVTLTYHDPVTNPSDDPNQGLVTDTYTLFVRAANIHADLGGGTDGLAVGQPGQLAVANHGSNNVSLVNIVSQTLANGSPGPVDGTLGAISNYPVAQSSTVTAVQVASVLGNVNTPDLVVLTDTQVVILPGKAGGGFSTDPATIRRLNLPAGSRAGSMVVADLNADGLLDIAVADSRYVGGVPQGNNSVTVFLNSTVGFSAGTSYAAGANPIGIVAGDFDLAGLTDLAVANAGKDTGGNFDINLLFNRGGINIGTFGAAVPIQTGKTAATDMVIGDPNGSLSSPETRGDLIRTAAHPNQADFAISTTSGVVVMENVSPSLLGPGSDFIPISLPTDIVSRATSVTVGNFSDRTDGLLDIAVTDGQNIFVFKNDASAPSGFDDAVKITVGGSNITKLFARQVQTSPPSGTHTADILAVDEATSQVIVVLNNSTVNNTLSFSTTIGRYRVDSNPLSLDVTDASGDGVPDAITANSGGSDVSVVRGMGDGTFLTSTEQGIQGSGPDAIAVGDLVNNGLPDIVIADQNSNTVEVFLAQGNGTYSESSYAVGQDPVAVALGDINGDGFEDIVVANQLDNTLAFLINNGHGGFTLETNSSGGPYLLKTGPTPTDIALGDFAHNGVMDIAVSHTGNGSVGRGVSVFLGIKSTTTGLETGTFQPPVEYATSLNAVAVTAADFNRDGILDLAVLDKEGTGQVAILQGTGTGAFTQTGLFPAGADPTSFTVGDLNRDGYPDIVVADTDPVTNSGSLAVLLNAAGNGFNAPTYITSPQFSGVPFQSVIVTDVNQDLYPDIVVSTGAGSGNNLFTLLGNGDGTFQQPTFPYAVSGGSSAPSYVALVSDPFVRVTTFTTSGTLVGPNLIANGSFETLSLSNGGSTPEKGNLVGWSTYDELNSNGQWGPETGTVSPLSSTTVPVPPQGSYAAMLDQSYLPLFTASQVPTNGANDLATDGTHILYQDIVISPTATLVQLSFQLYIDNTNAVINGVNTYSNTTLNPSLDYIQSENSQTPNQQVSIDIMDPTFSLLSVPAAGQTTGNGVLQSIFQTNSTTLFGTTRNGAPGLQYMNIQDILAGEAIGYNVLPAQLAAQAKIEETTTLNLTGLKFPTQDRTVRLRIAVANTLGQLIVGVDNVKVTEVYNDTEAPILTGLQLRNPGFGVTPTNAGDTTDPTIQGVASDNGSVNNIAYVLVDTQFNQPGHTNFQPGAGVYRTNTFDAVGNWVTSLPLDLPSQIVNGQVVPTVVGVEVVDKAGNTSEQSLSFINQGPNQGVWQSMGPGPIDTTGIGLDYTSVSGEVTAIAVDPRDTSGNTFYVGSANGGVWKTTDGGVDWTPEMNTLTDANGNPVSASIGALAIDPTTPNDVFAGTGIPNHAYDSQTGFGLFESTTAGKSWSQIGGTVFANSRISTIAVARPDLQGITDIYVAVAVGGQFGPGLYRSQDGGKTWTNVLNPNNMFLHGGGTLASLGVTSVASVTDLVIDRLAHEDHDLYIGIGNIGFVNPATGNAGLSAGLWQSPDAGATWFQQTGGVTPFVHNDTLPTGNNVGKIELAIPETRVQDDGIIYVMISDAVPFGSTTDAGSTRGSAIADAAGNADLSGLYKSKNGGDDWTHVMLRQSVPIPNNPNHFMNLELSADESTYVGSLVVDPTDPNVVYLGGARLDDSIPAQPTTGSIWPQRGFLRVDTSDMRDTTYFDPFTLSYINDGDDIQKALAAGKNRAYPAGGAYVGEGVYWQDLEQNTSGASDIANSYLPPVIHDLVFDSQGRLLIATDGGLWRGISYGFGYDFSSSPGAILSTEFIGNLAKTQGMTFTSLNGNLEISNTSSVAIDPTNPNVLYSANGETGWALTDGSITWSTMGELPNGPTERILPNDPGTVLAAPVNPTLVQTTTIGNVPIVQSTSGAIPTTVYLAVSLREAEEGLQNASLVNVLQSLNGGQVGTFSFVNTGLRPTDTPAQSPALAIDPQKIFVESPTDPTTGSYQDLLIYGTQRVYRSENSSTSWLELSPALPANDVITADAASSANAEVFYVGTQQGKIYVTLNDGGDGFPNRSTGLPTDIAINGITVDPTNYLVAYALVGGSGGHVFRTTNGGSTWQDITSNLPNVAAYSLAIDPTLYPDTPQGRLYVGTQVGVYTSTNLGASWTRLGGGLPNVPVLDVQFNKNFEKLAVATLGRGVYDISTDRIGPIVIAYTPALPSSPGLSSVTVTFDHAVDPRTFLPSDVRDFVGPNGPITVSSVKVVDPATDLQFQISFPAQSSNGSYSFNLSPTITDLAGNELDQSGGYVNGQDPQDSFVFQFALNNSDDGAFVSGSYHDLLGRPADVGGFINLLSAVDIARFQTLISTATSILTSGEARGDLIDNFNNNTGYYPEFLRRLATPSEVAAWVQALNQGETPQQVIASIVGSDEYFTQSLVGGIDATFVNQLYVDLLGRPADSSGLTTFEQQLSSAEMLSRVGAANGLDQSTEYQTNLINSDYSKFLGRTPSSAEVATWLGQFQVSGFTDESLIANIVSSDEYFNNHGGTNSGYVTALYSDLLGRSPDPTGFSILMNQLQAGASRASVALELLTSGEYRQDLIEADYQKYLGRSADAGGLNYFIGLFQKGATDETIVSTLVASGEYFSNHAGGATTQHALDLNWIGAAYQDVLGRPADSGGIATFSLTLDQAEIAARTSVAQSLLSSTEYETDFITGVYQKYLQRAPGGAEVAHWLAILNQPSSGPGQPSPEEQFEAAVIGSSEYFYLQTNSSNQTSNVQWLLSVYENVLGRAPDTNGFNTILNNLLNSYQPQRLNMETAVTTSNEYLSDTVTAIYETYLRRAPSASELTAGVAGLQTGSTNEALIANLTSSVEYYSSPKLGQNNNSTWLNQAYNDLLGRNIANDPGAQALLTALNNGKLTRSQITTAIVQSTEYRDRLIALYYKTYLGRAPSSSDLTFWNTALAKGEKDEQMLAAILASNEYFLLPHTYP